MPRTPHSVADAASVQTAADGINHATIMPPTPARRSLPLIRSGGPFEAHAL